MGISRLLQGRLYRKYVVYFLVLISATLFASGASGLYYSYNELRTGVAALQQEKALGAAARIERFVRDIERQIVWIRLPPDVGDNALERRHVEFEKLLRYFPSISEVSWLDGTGHEQLKGARLAIDRRRSGIDLSATPTFRLPRPGQPYFGPVYFHKDSEPFLTMAVADEHTGAGVTVAEVNLSFVSDVASRIQVGATGYAYVVDGRGNLISHPDISLVLRKTNLLRLPQVRAALTPPVSAAENAEEPIDAFDHAGNRVLAAHVSIAPLGWTVLVEQPLTEAFAPLYARVARMIILLAIGMVLAVVASLLLARRMVTPIQALQAGVARIGAGVLDQRIEVNTGDELEALASEFHRMAARLRESYADLEQKVAERTRELVTANRAISRFLAAASHDLRQPLHALGLYTAALCDRQFSDDTRRLVGQIVKSVSMMQDLLEALLDISRLDAGAVSPDISDFPVSELLARLETHYAPAADAKAIALRVATCRAHLRSDPVLLERILLNLVSNAVRYTRVGKVLVGCRRRDGYLRIEVWDTGCGIPEDQQRLIFEEFRRAAGAEHNPEKGLGLGLAIVERLAELLGHAIEVRSTPGKGSMFAVTVPLATGETSGKDRVEETARAGASMVNTLVTVIDDDPTALKATQTLLENWGCRVLTASSGPGAESLLSAQRGGFPAIIICDYHLAEGETGIQVLDRLRAAFADGMQGILVTGDTSAAMARAAADSAYPLLHKPVRPARLRALLDHCLRTRHPPDRHGR